MAAQVLRRGEAVVWVPPRSVGERAFATEPRLLAMLPSAVSEKVAGPSGRPSGPVTVYGTDRAARYARLSLDSMPPLKTVKLVFDARDVTLLRVKVPPLPPARLQQALPNIVEDMLLQDAQACALAVGPRTGEGDERLVAAIDRSWLEFVVGAFERRGSKVAAAWPAQLALPVAPRQLSIACVNDGLALRSGVYEGIGWGASQDADFRAEALAEALANAMPAAAEAPEPALTGANEVAVTGLPDEPAAGPPSLDEGGPLRVAAFVEDPSWEAPARRAFQRAGVEFAIRPLPLPKQAPLDLLGGRRGSAAQRWLADIDWRAWRLPTALAAGCVLAWLAGLNLHWAALAAERDDLKAQIERTFRQTFPNAQVIVDPLLQMQRQLSTLRARAGQSGPDDFVPLLARFSQALGPQATDSLSAVEYREGRLRVRFQPGFYDSKSLRDSLAAACQRQGLRLQFDSEREPTATVALLQ